jgi:cytochrome c biogenesis protein CcmG, thiol:disulfide interchange protein DsbE
MTTEAASPEPTSSPGPDRWRRPLIGPFTVGQFLAVVASIAVAAVALVVLTSPLTVPQPTPPRPGSSFVAVGSAEPGLRVGDLAPEFSGTTPSGETVQLTDLNGNPVRLADLRGRPVWINFWATWCPPCQEETPILRDVYQAYSDDGLALVAISVQETTADDVRAYVNRYSLGYTVGFDATSAIFHTYHAFGLPTQLFLDRDGIIRKVVLGPITRGDAEATVAGLLGLGPSSPAAASPSPTPPATP